MTKNTCAGWLLLSVGALSLWGAQTRAEAADIRFISHRGESLDAPENTMAAFRLAVARGTAGFECDVYRTADNEIVCIHDATTTRTTDGSLTVSNATLAELKALDAGSRKSPAFKGERIPTLSEALALAQDDFAIFVEIKCGTEILPRLVEVLAAEPKATPERVLFIAFNTNVVSALRQRLPAYRAYWLTATKRNADGSIAPAAASAIATAKACRASGIDAQASAALSEAYVREVKQAGLSFHVWTVDNPRTAAELAAMGAETITSNCGAALAALTRVRTDGRPVVHWTFDGTPTNSGSGGSAFDAGLSGSPRYTAGAVGRGLALDGTNDVASVVYPFPEQGAIALWYRPAAFYNFNTVFDDSRHANQWEMWITGTGVLRFRMGPNSGDMTYNLSGIGGPGQWYHIALAWDNVTTNQAVLYVNGAERARAPVGRWVAPGGVFNLGGGNAGNSKGRGAADDVRIYAEPLTEAQIRALSAAPPAAAAVEGFEGLLPAFHTYQATYAADTSRAHAGMRSLRVTPTKDFGGAYFKLDGTLDFKSDYEYAAWIHAGTDRAVSLYISASNGKERYTVSSVSGGVSGKWVRLSGVVRANQWRPGDREMMLALSTRGESWFDDVTLRKTVVPEPAIDVWPRLEANLRAAADRHAVPLRRGQRVSLTAERMTLAPEIARTNVVPVNGPDVTIPAEGLLTVAVDAEEPLYVTGEVELEPDADLRPGLRAYVLSDDTLVGAPMVAAAPWHNVGKGETGPAPVVSGIRPDATFKLSEWRLAKGRHYLTVAGAHLRPAGRFRRLELRALQRPAPEPLYAFALFADTHLGEGRHEWMNVKMDGPAIAELGATLRRLRGEGVSFAFIAGDMTDGGSRAQVEALAGAVRSAGMPVYGCIGNHEVFTAGSRTNLAARVPGLFPSGETQYVLEKPPLRFIVLDGSWWRDREGNALAAYDRTKAVGVVAKPSELDWLRQTLAADTRTPTLALWHYPFYSSRGDTSCGYRLGGPKVWSQEVLSLLEAAPNVAATLNGHMHYNAADTYRGIACLQNAAYVEWPNQYRVLRVYPDGIEWEVRQVHNRGFVSEGCLPEKALSWMISTRDGDLAGRVGLAPRKKDR